MGKRFGSGSLQYELVENWEQIPDGWTHPDVPGVCTDADANVYLFCRGDHPVMVYDREGKFLGSWGEGEFTLRTHGMYMRDGNVLYLVDDAAHTVARYSLDGRRLETIGPSGTPSDSGYDGSQVASITHGGGPYNRPTNLSVGSNGDRYVSDGYGNCQVHRFDANGGLIQSWGEPGTGPGQFHLPHSVFVHTDGRVFVADRENDRIQIFDADGNYLTEWTDVQRPQDIFIDQNGLVYVGELVWRAGMSSFRRGKFAEEQPARLSIFDLDGNPLLRFGHEGDPVEPGNFVAPHGIWVDKFGDIYLSEVTQTIGVSRGLVPFGTHTIQKFARI